jgi:hypothetical protein
MKAVRQCAQEGGRAFIDEDMADGSIVHSVVRQVGVNPVTGTAAVAAAVLSISGAGEGAAYATIARALAADYYNIYCVDLDTDRFIEYSSPLGGEELALERHGEHFFEEARKDSMTRVYEEDREVFLKNFTKANILRKLDTQSVFTASYRLIDTGKPMVANMKVTRMNPGGRRIIIGIQCLPLQDEGRN